VRELNATLDRDAGLPKANTIAPVTVHWCLAPATARASAIGSDGHPALGLAQHGIMPPVPLPRRMWAGGQLQFHDSFRVGDAVERHSQIADVKVKMGNTGTLCFVTVSHKFSTPRGLAVTERQDIVYRALTRPPPDAKPPRKADLPAPEWQRAMGADPVLLFRYSAITFNGHRIHYDRSYAVKQEFYAGLLVHGPLQATLLAEFAAEIFGRPPAEFGFRGVNPLFDFQRFTLGAVKTATGLRLWIVDQDGVQTMEATAA
jgi:3-methylfumaryl-CoA hydratase